MNIETRLSIHGKRRLYNRSSLSDIDIDGYISSGLAVFYGRQFDGRVRWLIWSENDHEAKIVIRNEATKEVITVLNESHRGVQVINPSYVEYVKKLVSLRGKPSFKDIRIADMQRTGVKATVRLMFLVRPLTWKSTLMVGTKRALQDIEDLDKPWKDEGVSLNLCNHWEKSFPCLNALVIEQIIMRLHDDTAYSTIYPEEIFQRPQ